MNDLAYPKSDFSTFLVWVLAPVRFMLAHLAGGFLLIAAILMPFAVVLGIVWFLFTCLTMMGVEGLKFS